MDNLLTKDLQRDLAISNKYDFSKQNFHIQFFFFFNYFLKKFFLISLFDRYNDDDEGNINLISNKKTKKSKPIEIRKEKKIFQPKNKKQNRIDIEIENKEPKLSKKKRKRIEATRRHEEKKKERENLYEKLR